MRGRGVRRANQPDAGPDDGPDDGDRGIRQRNHDAGRLHRRRSDDLRSIHAVRRVVGEGGDNHAESDRNHWHRNGRVVYPRIDWYVDDASGCDWNHRHGGNGGRNGGSRGRDGWCHADDTSARDGNHRHGGNRERGGHQRGHIDGNGHGRRRESYRDEPVDTRRGSGDRCDRFGEREQLSPQRI